MKLLGGIRVLDLTKVLAGPLCTQYLGDMGADIIKVEPCHIGDDTRRWPPFSGETGAVFLSCNRNKRSLAMDLKSPEGKAIAHKLAAAADVVIESYGTGVVERLGIDYATLRALNPRLIYCSISGFGRDGPLKDAKGYDVILQAFSGMMGITGHEGGEPVRSPISPIDQATGMHALSGILAALLRRGQTGEGTRLEVSLFETAMAFLGYNFQSYWVRGTMPEKCGSGHEGICPYQAFEAADKPILIGIANDNLWQKFCRAVGRETLMEDPRFRTNPDRVAHRAETVGLVQEIIRTRSCEDWMDLLTALGVPCTPIHTLEEVLAHPHTAARGIVLDYQHPVLGALQTIAQPIQFYGETRSVGMPPPMHGEHSRAVLHELGYADAEIGRMAAAGVIVEAAA
jgi:crotonobetainyl-CoA:carnitine CoA-transferase CaiB-like acyl-CoA transferase